MLGANDALVLDNGGVRETLQKSDFVAQLVDLLRCLAFELDALDRDDAARVEIESAENGAELTATDALAELLHEEEHLKVSEVWGERGK